jgi:glucuronate isomerase
VTTTSSKMLLWDDRYFGPDAHQKKIALELYSQVAGLPLICPHGHVDARLFSDPKATFGSPAELFIIPDHYVTRLLYSQGIPLESLGVPRLDGTTVESDHRRIWRIFCENYHLFRGTPSGIWLASELGEVFGITEKPSASNADRLYDLIAEKVTAPEFSPRALFERFRIEVLCTTDAAADPLYYHQTIRQSGWSRRILPTFRPDGVTDLENPLWRKNIDDLSAASGLSIGSFAAYIQALEQRRAFFKSMGAVATDHAAMSAFTETIPLSQVETIFERALRGEATRQDTIRFTGHMLVESARMSLEDGLVMQLHVGAYRNYNRVISERFGPDKGADMPVRSEFTRELFPLLDKYGNDTRLTLILFTLDESVYARELAPLAGHYPALKLGPPWWFHDSPNGMNRYFDQVMETAGLYNTTGFNDDTRAFCSIPARHDVWRRVSANWAAGLVVRHIIDMDDAQVMMGELAGGLARRAYKL